MGKGVFRMLKHVTMQEAIALTLEQPVSRRMENVPFSNALGHVLADDVYAQTDLPPFNKSPFDGYAYRTADVPGTLRVVGVHTAGVQSLTELHPGEAVQIFTGAPMPERADAVVKQEDVNRTEDEITIPAPVKPGTNVILRGEDVRCGALLIPVGTRLLPAHLGELAGQGIANVRVWRRPKAVLLPTGSGVYLKTHSSCLFRQKPNRCKQHKSQKRSCQLIVAGSHPAECLDFVKETFHQMPLLVGVKIAKPGFNACFGRNSIHGPLSGNVVPDLR